MPTHSDAAVRLTDCSTSDAKDVLAQLGVLRVVMTGLRSIAGPPLLCGPARTLRMLPMREDLGPNPRGPLNRYLIDEIRAGEVLVIDAIRASRGAMLGDMMAARLVHLGAGGVVTDGPVRDAARVSELGLPVFAAGCDPDSSRSWSTPWEADTSVQCGGVLVQPGDWILADCDGVLVIPSALVEEVGERLARLAQCDEFSQALIAAGHPLQASYPLSDSRAADLEHFIRDGTVPKPPLQES